MLPTTAPASRACLARRAFLIAGGGAGFCRYQRTEPLAVLEGPYGVTQLVDLCVEGRRPPARGSPSFAFERIKRRPVLGGLVTEYERAA